MYKNKDGHVMKISVDDKKLIMEISIKDIAFLFANSPNNYDESKVKRGKQKEFAEWIAKNLTDEADADTGDCYWIQPFERLFECASEGGTETKDGGLIKYGSDN